MKMIQPCDSRESELQNLLTDERGRCNQYKEIYQTLKGENAKLQDELRLIHNRLKEAVSQNERAKAANIINVCKLEDNIKEQKSEINSLLGRLKACDEKNICASVFEEASTHYEVKIKEFHVEADKIRDQYNNLHYDHAILRCNFDSRESEYSHTLDRINLQHQGEIEELKSKIESFEKSSPSDSYAMELKSSKREVLQLNSKVKVLLSECEELRAQNDNLSLQISSINRTNLKQIADHLTNICSLESEKLKAQMQKEVLEKELLNAQEHRKVLSKELQDSRREVLLLKSRMEECEHKYRMKITNLQVDMEQWKAAKQSAQEQFLDEISRLNSELQTLHSNLSQERQAMIAKEQDLHQNLSAAKQQLWKQSREMNQDKDQMQRSIKEMEIEREDLLSQLSQVKQRLQLCAASKTELEKELLSSKNQSGQLTQVSSNQNINYEKEIQDLKQKIDFLSATGVPGQREMFQNEGQKSNFQCDHEVLQLKLSWEQQKLQYIQRLDELESQLKESISASAAEKKELDFKLKLYTKQINKLQERLEHEKAQNEELESEKDRLEGNIPLEIHSQVKTQLTDLQRRLEKYHLLITAEPKSASKISFSEKMLTDIKNIQSLPFQITKEAIDCTKNGKDKAIEKDYAKKTFRSRRKSMKRSLTKKDQTKTVSPTISSSSELDLENL